MTDDTDITAAFWHHLRADRTVMLGLEARGPTTLRPMTALLEKTAGQGPIWFLSATDATLVTELQAEDLGIFTFASKGHEIFATVHGHLTPAADAALIDRLWNPRIAAWYKGGRNDPTLVLLRFDPVTAEIWRDGSGLLAGLHLMLGGKPRTDPKDSMARVALS